MPYYRLSQAGFRPEKLGRLARKAQTYLLNQQNNNGSWGGKTGVPDTIEETSHAISALAQMNDEVCTKAIKWLEKQELLKSSPIGLYFALLWYDERMYPLIYYTEVLRRFVIVVTVERINGLIG